LQEEAKQKEIARNIRKLVEKRIEYYHGGTMKRTKSWKGRTKGPLFEGFLQDNWIDYIKGEGRAVSR
jgi:hypothetical protein